MKNSMFTAGFLSLAFLMGCFGTVPTPAPTPPPAPEPIRNTQAYDERKNRDEDRVSVLRESNRRSRAEVCEDEDKNHDCYDECRDIYKRRSDREDCEELKTDQIERLVELHELLEDPDDDELADIDRDDLDVYLNVSVEAWESHIGRYSSREIKEVMAWLAEDEEITEIIEKEDDDHKVLKAMLEELDSNSLTGNGENVHQAFIAKIDGGDRLMEVVIASGNETAAEWFQGFINEEFGDTGEHCADDTSEECFTIYCKIGNGIDRDSRDDWLRFEEFEEYIEDIIDEPVNGCANPSGTANCDWDTDTIEDLGDVNDWKSDLCGGLLT